MRINGRSRNRGPGRLLRPVALVLATLLAGLVAPRFVAAQCPNRGAGGPPGGRPIAGSVPGPGSAAPGGSAVALGNLQRLSRFMQQQAFVQQQQQRRIAALRQQAARSLEARQALQNRPQSQTAVRPDLSNAVNRQVEAARRRRAAYLSARGRRSEALPSGITGSTR